MRNAHLSFCVRVSTLWATWWGASLSLAQSMPEQGAALPYGDCATSYWSSNRNLDDKRDVLSAHCMIHHKVKLRPELVAAASMTAGWQAQGNASTEHLRLREAYLDWQSDGTSVKAGRQIISWGRADGMNPTDRLAPRDFTLLSAEDDTQRMGVDAIKLQQVLMSNTAMVAILAKASTHVTAQGSLPPNLAWMPTPNKAEWAVKLDHRGQGVDGAISYFHGFQRSPHYWLDVSRASQPMYQGRYASSQSLGADMAISSGALTWRAEASHERALDTCMACGGNSWRVNRWVMGGDVDFGDAMNLNVQYFGTRYSDFSAQNQGPAVMQQFQIGRNLLNRQFAAIEQGITLRLSDRLMNDKLRWELNAIFDLTGHSHVLRPRITFGLDDSVKFFAGIDWFDGDALTYFGSLARNRAVFAGWVLVF